MTGSQLQILEDAYAAGMLYVGSKGSKDTEALLRAGLLAYTGKSDSYVTLTEKGKEVLR